MGDMVRPIRGRCPECKRRVATFSDGRVRRCYKHRRQDVPYKPICSGSRQVTYEHDATWSHYMQTEGRKDAAAGLYDRIPAGLTDEIIAGLDAAKENAKQ